MKLIGDTECPGCKKSHKVEFDLDKLDIPPTPAQNTQATGQQTIQEVKSEIKEVEKIVEKTVTPSDEPFFACANGNCGDGVHRNENYKTKPNKKCKNCDSLNGKKKCKNCGNTDEEEFDELDDEELKELNIPLPNEEESNEGHNHG